MPHPYIHTRNPLILASASPRRSALLAQVRIPFRVVPSNVSEDSLEGELPAETTRRLAERKAAGTAVVVPAWVLGADTVVVEEGAVLGKPQDAQAAVRMLRLLSGREHSVITGFALLDPAGRTCHSEAIGTRVRFRTLSAEEILGYVETGEPFGKAGAYAIQGIGAFLVESIQGSYTNVVGLPLCALVGALLKNRALERFPILRSAPLRPRATAGQAEPKKTEPRSVDV